VPLPAFFLTAALLPLGFGLSFLIVPGVVLPLYGVDPAPATLLMARFFGAAMVQWGAALYFVREVNEAPVRRGLLLGGLIGSAAGLAVALTGQLAGLVNTLGWSTVAIYGCLLAGFAALLRAPQAAARTLPLVSGLALVLGSCTPARPVDRNAGTGVASASAATAEPGVPSSVELAELARRVITTTIGVRPGEVVIVNGGKHTVGLMEEMAMEAAKAGGLPMLWLESDRVARSTMTDVKDEYLDLKPRHLVHWFGHTNVWIGLGAFEDARAVYADVPESKLAKTAAAGQEVYDMLNGSPLRGAFIGYPTRGRAEEVGLDYERYAAMLWAAIGTDYGRIATAAEKLERKLGKAKGVRITTPAGTDLRFKLIRRPVVVDAGIVRQDSGREGLMLNRFASLPGGAVAMAPEESSVTGTLVVPRDRCKYRPLRNARYEFAKGTLTSAKADDGGACLEENLAVYGQGMRRLGYFTIGLNPEMKVIENGADYRPGVAAGMVTLSLGDNSFYGGANTVPGAMVIDIPVTGATMELDGERIVDNGALVEGAKATASR
jgi:aminopeptidase